MLRRLMAKHHLDPKKSLSQHFLVDAGVIQRIVFAVGEVRSILEIGPGPGVLTRPLQDFCEHLTAIEIDPRARPLLQEIAPRADVRIADALQIDLVNLLNEMAAPRVIVSNMPYAITGPLLDKIEACHGEITHAVLMMQREVAERISAPAGDGKRGAISVRVQMQFDVEVVVDAPPACFLPPPQVNSTVLKLVPKGNLKVQPSLNKILKSSFTQPRKTLANNLADGGFGSKAGITDLLQTLALSPSIRPHQLTEEEWLRLDREMNLKG